MEIMKKIKAAMDTEHDPQPITLAFIGDSVTHGCFELLCGPDGSGHDVVYDFEAVYHARLKKLLEAAFIGVRFNIINAAKGGDNSPGGLRRVERDVIAHAPDLAVVCYGLNDAGAPVEKYREAMGGIFEKLKAAGIETIYMTPNMMCTSVSDDLPAHGWPDECARHCCELQNGGALDRITEAGKAAAAEYGVTVCDCYGKWKKLAAAGADVNHMLCNRINHPTREMHALFASSLFDTIIQ